MESREHTRSYYAATANWETSYPVLEGTHQADVCIVGAGFTGIRTALFLAEQGYSVAVIEARRVSWGASGRNGGQVIGGFCSSDKIEKRFGKNAADMNWKLGAECTAMLRRNVEKYNIDCNLKPGYVEVALTQRQVNEMLESKENNERRGYPYKQIVVSQDQMHSVVKSDAYVGGLIDEGNGHVHPLNLCIGEARAAETLGVKIFELSEVKKITRGSKPGAYTDKGSVTANFLVLAGNAYLGGLAPELKGAVLPAGSYIIGTEPLGDLGDDLIPQDMAVCDLNEVVDYFRLSADKRLLYGGRCNYSGRTPRSIKAAIVPRMLKIFPQLKGVRIDYEWGGNIGICLNRLPLIGRIEPNIYHGMGYSGHGVAPTYIAAKILAEAITGQTEKIDIYDKIHHLKLPGGKWFASPALALGMLYYRLMDLR